MEVNTLFLCLRIKSSSDCSLPAMYCSTRVSSEITMFCIDVYVLWLKQVISANAPGNKKSETSKRQFISERCRIFNYQHISYTSQKCNDLIIIKSRIATYIFPYGYCGVELLALLDGYF